MKKKLNIIVGFLLISCLNVSAAQVNCEDNQCSFLVDHKHENNWIRIIQENGDSVLCRTQQMKSSNYENLVLNLYEHYREINHLELSGNKLRELLSCFASSTQCGAIAEGISANCPGVNFIELGLYDPVNKKKHIKSLKLIEDEEYEELAQELAKKIILIINNKNHDTCLDSPHNEKNLTAKIGSRKISKTNYALNSLPVGIPVGFILLGVLALNDHFELLKIAGGPEFQVSSCAGQIIPVSAGVIMMAIFCHYLQIDCAEFFR